DDLVASRILRQARAHLFAHGYCQCTMDELAAELGMSKKTLYEHFQDKNDLVEQVVAAVCGFHRAAINAICARGLNAIDENEEITKFIVGQVGNMHPSVQFDLQKYHPRAWGILERRQQEDIHACVSGNLRRGIAEGLYREDLDVEVITRLYIARIDSTWDGRVFPPDRFDLSDVLWKHFEYHIRGIASRKGVAYLEKKARKARAWMRTAATALVLAIGVGAWAQGPINLSLRQAIDMAAKQSYQVRNSVLEAEKARKRIMEIAAIGLPQISASGGLINYLDVPTQVVPNFFGPGPELVTLKFGVPWSANGGIRLDQLLFDGSYLVGLQAAREARKMADEELERAIKDARIQAAKAYHAVLAADEGARLLGETVPVLEKNLRDSEVMFANGFMEETDVDRIRIELANIRDQRIIFQRQAEVARNYLRFVLGLPSGAPLELTDDLETLIADPAEMALSSEPFDRARHIDQRIAETYIRASALEWRNARAAYLPSLSGFFSHQQQWNANTFEPINGPIPWFPATLWGVQLNVPVFSSGMRAGKAAQMRLQLQQAEVNRDLTTQRLELEYSQRRNDMLTAEELYRNERDRMELSRRVFERTSLKFTEGMASSFELTQEQSQYIAAQQSYIQRVVDLVNARAELRRALDRF
ncbi:MAG: TolC family protein, partial [Flavobacteriales bacterium]